MPPSAIVASKAMASDPRAEPKYCERVPYVVVAGPAGARLMDLVREGVVVNMHPIVIRLPTFNENVTKMSCNGV